MKNLITFPNSVKSGQVQFRLNSDDWSKGDINELKQWLRSKRIEFKCAYRQHPTKCIGNYCFTVSDSFNDFNSMMQIADNIITEFKISQCVASTVLSAENSAKLDVIFNNDDLGLLAETNTILLTTKQEDAINKTYDWITNVVTKQGRFLPFQTMWAAYPFKVTGMNETGFKLIFDEMINAVQTN